MPLLFSVTSELPLELPVALDEPVVGSFAKAIKVVSIPGQIVLRARERDVRVAVVRILVDPIDVPCARSTLELFVHRPPSFAFHCSIGEVPLGMVGH